jgi:hypothetical protein
VPERLSEIYICCVLSFNVRHHHLPRIHSITPERASEKPVLDLQATALHTEFGAGGDVRQNRALAEGYLETPRFLLFGTHLLPQSQAGHRHAGPGEKHSSANGHISIFIDISPQLLGHSTGSMTLVEDHGSVAATVCKAHFAAREKFGSWAAQNPVLNTIDALLTLTELSSVADSALLYLVFLSSQSQSLTSLSGGSLSWHDSCTFVVAGGLFQVWIQKLEGAKRAIPQRQSSNRRSTQDLS